MRLKMSRRASGKLGTDGWRSCAGQEQPFADLLVGQAAGRQVRDLPLLGRERSGIGSARRAEGATARAQFLRCSVSPGSRAKPRRPPPPNVR
jgi:hypothetical protein